MISVVIPCYNAADDIEEAIHSVLQQSRDDLVAEIIIVDDGSTDDSGEIVRRLATSDSRIKYVYQKNKGPSVARNTGVALSSEEYVAFLDADDLWLEDKIERQAQFLQKHPEIGLLYTDAFAQLLNGSKRRVVANHLDYQRDDNLERLFVKGGPILTPTVIMKTNCFTEVGGFDPALPKGQDSDLWLRTAAVHSVHHLREPLVLTRKRRESVASNAEDKAVYLRQITKKMIDAYPRLEKYRAEREAMIESYVGLYLLRKGERGRASRCFIKAISLYGRDVKSYILLIVSLIPVENQTMSALLDAMGEAKNKIKSLLK